VNIISKTALATRVAINAAMKSARYAFTHPEVIRNRYEAGQRWQYGDRSAIWSHVVDARFDADQATRWELVRKARYFEANSALVQRIADVWEQYVVGANGLILLPDSDDEQWAGAAAQWFEEWGQFPDLTSLQNWATLQSLIARTWLVDGEVFLLKTRGQSPPYRPRLQLIEGHRVGTPGKMLGNPNVIDGVEIDGKGRPVAYYVQDGVDGGEYTRITADNIIHIFEPNRVGMYRGISHFYAVMNALHDLDDLERLEMQAAKDAASTTKIVKTPSGEETAEETEWSGVQTSETGAANPLFEYYRKVFGATTKVMKIGDEYEQFVSNRPSVVQQWYWKYLTEKVCTGVGIPIVMVFPDSMQGTVYRGVLDTAAAFFRSRSKVLETSLRQVWEYVIDTGSRFDSRIANKPADWKRLVCRPPRSPNVDVGRNSQAMLAELEANTRTLQDVYAETGDDWKQKLRQRAKEKDFLKSLGLTPEEALPKETKPPTGT
jgi:lambda family phage portal protein